MRISFFVIIGAYVACHMLTRYLVTPVQEQFLADVTVFASLVYLPHGVRVLATWLYGWKAILPLALGSLLADFLFTPAEARDLMYPAISGSIAVGSVAAFVVFEVARLTGRNLYANDGLNMNWKCLIAVGSGASLFNSIGNSMVYKGIILPELTLPTLGVYLVGDIIGLIVAMVVLMFAFRWARFADSAGR